MAQTIKLKRSGTEGNIPTTSQLELGEVAINTYDGKMFIKKDVGGTESIVEISAAAADAILVEYQFTSTAGQTTYSGSDDNTETLSYTPNAIQVFMNGILLDPGIDFTATNGTSIVLSEAADANDYLQIFAFKKKISDGQVSVDTFTGDDSTVAFTLSVDPGDENNTRVFIDGVYQSKANYSVSGTTLTFSTAPPTGTAVEVEIGNRVVTLDTLSDLDLPDSVKLRLGTDQDLQIYHDGSHSYINEQGTGNLYLNTTNGGGVFLTSAGENLALFNSNGAVNLYYDNSAKFATTNDGVTVTGDVEADEFIGDIRGAVLFKASAGEALAKGDVVYISGISGNTTVVSKADADDANKMPAFGIAAAAASANNPVDVYTSGILSGIDTSSFSEGDELFVSTTAGVLTATPPTGESAALQKIGKVTRSASNGSIFIIGAGRSNAVPNLNEGRLFVGNSSNQAVADDTVHVDIANSVVGINKTNPSSAAALHVDGHIYVDTGDAIYADHFQPYSTTLATYGSSTNTDHYFLGDVGIGTNSPAQKLDVRGKLIFGGTGSSFYGNAGVFNTDSNGDKIIFYDDSGSSYDGRMGVGSSSNLWIKSHGESANEGIIELKAGGSIQLETGTTPSERMRIDSNGDVGINATDPLRKLHVAGNFAVNASTSQYYGVYIDGAGEGADPNILIGDWHNASATLKWDSSARALNIDTQYSTGSGTFNITGNDGASTWMTVDTSGNVGVGTSSPRGELEIESSGVTNLYLTRNDATINDTNSLGVISFSGTEDGSTYIDGAQIYAKAEVSWSSGDYKTGLAFATNSGSTLTERMRIDFDGNVGIGTDDPTRKLVVKGTLGLEATNSTNQWLAYTYTDNTYRLNYGGSGADEFILTAPTTANRTAVYIDSENSLLAVGTGSPTNYGDTKLHLYGDGSTGIVGYVYNNGANAQSYLNFGNSTTGLTTDFSSATAGMLVGVDSDETSVLWNYENTAMRFGTNGTERMRLHASGNLSLNSNGDLTSIDGVSPSMQIGNSGTASAGVALENQHNGWVTYLTTSNGSYSIWDSTSNADRLTISPDGDVGIGTVSPTNSTNFKTLDIKGATGGQLLLGRSSQFDFFAFSSSSSTSIGTAVGQDLIFRTNSNGGNNERIRIKSGGNITVGTTNDYGRKFVVEGTGDLFMLRSTNTGAGGAQLDLMHDSASAADGDKIGRLLYSTDDRQYANIEGVAASHSNGEGELHFGTRQNTSTYNASQMVLNHNGYLGIGTSYPTTRLEVRDVVPVLTLSNEENKTWTPGDDIAKLSFFVRDGSAIGAHETGFILNEAEDGGTTMSGALVFGAADYNASATEAMRINAKGQLKMNGKPIQTTTDSGTKMYTGLATGSFYSTVGYLILKTNIPAHNVSGNANMFSISIEGFGYSNVDAGIVDLNIGCYSGENNYYNGSYSGSNIPAAWINNIYFAKHDSSGKLAIILGTSSASQPFEIAATKFIQGYVNVQEDYANDWDWVTATSTTGYSQLTKVQPRTTKNPRFSASSTGVSKSTGWEKISDGMTELHDNTGTYDASTGRFTPTMEGWYQFNFGGWASENDTSGADRYAIAFAKNGSLTYISGGAYCAVDSPLNGAAQSIYLDANDYVELWAYSSVATTWGGSSHHLWWEGYWVSS